eukprot:CAMPEP_0181515956 /NCGR_PEP_ID=MMETSP1110-20121109/63862_1 /TAXON_ID=174948 /ORGANISM="Symbiodinium sp., Strain CCMP421" /LENGTH=125 /DNA_ID=CAMNT_0023646031 /DNA_START=32 /DNA_END=409 /DNA_ORIENTATION=-
MAKVLPPAVPHGTSTWPSPRRSPPGGAVNPRGEGLRGVEAHQELLCEGCAVVVYGVVGRLRPALNCSIDHIVDVVLFQGRLAHEDGLPVGVNAMLPWPVAADAGELCLAPAKEVLLAQDLDPGVE